MPSGIMMVVKILNSPAPSSLADSARDSGMDMKCWRYMKIPVVVVTTGRITPQMLLYRPMALITVNWETVRISPGIRVPSRNTANTLLE